MLKRFYTDIQSYIITLVKVFNSVIHYLKNLTNRSIWLNDNIKLFYIDIMSKLISLIILKIKMTIYIPKVYS